MLTCNTYHNYHAPTNMMIISITLMIPLALTCTQKSAELLEISWTSRNQLDFMMYVLLSMWICQNHNHKTRIMTNLNSYGLNSILISCHLVAQCPPLLSGCYANNWELIELTCTVNFNWNGTKIRICQHDRLQTSSRVLVINNTLD